MGELAGTGRVLVYGGGVDWEWGKLGMRKRGGERLFEGEFPALDLAASTNVVARSAGSSADFRVLDDKRFEGDDGIADA